MKKTSEYHYHERRRVAAALCLSVLVTIGDISAENGTRLPIVSAFGFFLVLTTGPLALGKLLDVIANSKDIDTEEENS